MSQWSWKQAVADRVLDILNSKKVTRFSLAELYTHERHFEAIFPANEHIRPKIRQTLQRLRDMGFIKFLDGGIYEINMGFSEIEAEPVVSSSEIGIVIPDTKTVLRTIRMRNSLLSADMKRRYANVCQVCRQALQLARGTYAEAHHLKPLGSPHFGSDTEDNILVLCPNHHAMFDRGAIMFDNSTTVISHVAHAFHRRELFFSESHRLNAEYVQYYQSIICNAC